jgi:hypothetical protein
MERFQILLSVSTCATTTWRLQGMRKNARNANQSEPADLWSFTDFTMSSPSSPNDPNPPSPSSIGYMTSMMQTNSNSMYNTMDTMVGRCRLNRSNLW